MCMENMIAGKFRDALKTNLPIKVFEYRDNIVVIVGDEQVFINIEVMTFCFVSTTDIVNFTH